MLVKTPKGWRIAALAWTEPVGNAAANARAKSGKLTAHKLDGDLGDQGLRDAFAKLTIDGVDATAAARSDLVALGSGPGERTAGGASFARAWNAAWKGKIAIVSSLGRALPSGTTGWVAATIELAKPGYKLPFTVFAVFDKIDRAWSLVHIQLAVDHDRGRRSAASATRSLVPWKQGGVSSSCPGPSTPSARSTGRCR